MGGGGEREYKREGPRGREVRNTLYCTFFLILLEMLELDRDH